MKQFPAGNPFVFIHVSADVGEGTKLGRFVDVGANCVVGKNCVLKSGAILAEGTILGSHVFVGPQTTTIRDQKPGGRGPKIAAGTEIGASCCIGADIAALGVVIGAGSVVLKPILEPGVYVGVPARRIRDRGAHEIAP